MNTIQTLMTNISIICLCGFWFNKQKMLVSFISKSTYGYQFNISRYDSIKEQRQSTMLFLSLRSTSMKYRHDLDYEYNFYKQNRLSMQI